MGIPFVARIAGGIVLVAIVVGIGLWAERLTDDGFTLPDRLAGLDALDSDDALEDLPADEREEMRDNTRENYETFSDQFAEQYDGAEATFRSYGTFSEDGTVKEPIIYAQAVRAETDPLVAIPNPRGLPPNAPADQLVGDGEVVCRVHARPKGSTRPFSVVCQRSDDDLTVQVVGTRGFEVDEIIDATNDVWKELS